jgi:hypothetical protein
MSETVANLTEHRRGRVGFRAKFIRTSNKQISVKQLSGWYAARGAAADTSPCGDLHRCAFAQGFWLIAEARTARKIAVGGYFPSEHYVSASAL